MLKKLEQSLISVDNDKTNNILQTISKLKLKFDKVNERIKESNNKFYSLKNENEQLADQFYEKQISFEKHILKIFRYVQDKFLKLNWEDEPIFPHEELLKNISNLKLAISGLRNNEDKDKILEYLFAVDNNFLANYFDKYVWDYFNDYVLKAPKEKLMWGEGRIVSHVDLYEIIEMLNEQENTKSIITKLESKLLDQENILNNVLENEFEDLNGLLNLVFEL